VKVPSVSVAYASTDRGLKRILKYSHCEFPLVNIIVAFIFKSSGNFKY
jgi:hypothetical protein